MKVKRVLLSLVTACCFAVFLCLSASMVMAGGVNPGTPLGYKQIGPQVKGTLIIGWHPDTPGGSSGRVEVHIIVEGKIYAGVPEIGVAESLFTDPTPLDLLDTEQQAWMTEIISREYPEEIAADNNIPTDESIILVRVVDKNDISNLGIKYNLGPVFFPHTPDEDLTYLHVVYCDVKLTFFEPVKKQPPTL